MSIDRCAPVAAATYHRHSGPPAASTTAAGSARGGACHRSSSGGGGSARGHRSSKRGISAAAARDASAQSRYRGAVTGAVGSPAPAPRPHSRQSPLLARCREKEGDFSPAAATSALARRARRPKRSEVHQVRRERREQKVAHSPCTPQNPPLQVGRPRHAAHKRDRDGRHQGMRRSRARLFRGQLPAHCGGLHPTRRAAPAPLAAARLPHRRPAMREPRPRSRYVAPSRRPLAERATSARVPPSATRSQRRRSETRSSAFGRSAASALRVQSSAGTQKTHARFPRCHRLHSPPRVPGRSTHPVRSCTRRASRALRTRGQRWRTAQHPASRPRSATRTTAARHTTKQQGAQQWRRAQRLPPQGARNSHHKRESTGSTSSAEVSSPSGQQPSHD